MVRTNKNLAMTVTTINIIENTVLTAFKMFAGIFGKSAAMVSDALHSLSDVVSTLIVKIGVRMANQAPDNEHPYGHERFECVAAIILSAILFITGAGIGFKKYMRMAQKIAICNPSPISHIRQIWVSRRIHIAKR